MSVYITSRTFTNELDSTPVNFALANVGEKIVITHNISVKEYVLASSSSAWVLNNTDGYIVTAGKPWVTGGDFSKFNIGDTLSYYDFGLATLTTGLVIVDKLSNTEIQFATNPVAWAANAAGTTTALSLATPVTSLSYKHNWIENDEATNYYSKIDGTTQLATITGLNPAGAGTNLPMAMIGSLCYQDGTITVDEVSLVTSPIYSSNFIIKHTCRITPVMLAEQWDDIQAGIKPPTFYDLACMKPVFYFEARYNLTDPNRIQTFEDDLTLGNTGYFNENFNSSLTNFSLGNLAYTDSLAVAIPTPQLLPGNVTSFSFEINNTDPVFVAASSKLVINFAKACISETEYQANGRDLKHNFVWDKALLTVQAVPVAVNGDNYADTTMRSLSDLKATRNSSTKITITGKLSFHANSVSVFEESDVPSYMFWVSIQDHTTLGVLADRANVKVDFNKFYYKAAFPNLITFNRKKLIPHITNVLDATAYSIGTTFAEDELVGYTKITVGTDPLVTSVELTKVAHRIIAYNTVTDEKFTLESKTITLPYVNVVSGFQNFDIAQDINIRVPSTEIRKQLTAKSLSTPGEFQFSYPFLVRWDYWTAIENGNSFFFDSTKPNNNLNNDWYKYSNIGYGGDWILRYECEISTKVNGSPASYTGYTNFKSFDRNYTHVAPDNDITFTIKTYDGATELVNGTGTRYILGYKNTLVKALFNCPTMTSSKPEVVIGLEVFEEGGTIGKRRMSSLYVSDSDTWFIPLTGETKVKVSNPTSTTILAEVEIDYLAIQSLVGKNKWKITARVDNDTDKMSSVAMDIDAYGYLASAEFTMISENPVFTETIVLPPNQLDCCGDLVWNVLADTATSDELKNDKNRFLWWFNEEAIDTAIISLIKPDGTSVALNSVTTYGTPYNYGFNTNGFNEKMVGYEIEWKKVLTVIGEGSYQLKCVSTSIFGGTTTQYSETYCLSQYNDSRANGTVRIEYIINGLLGDSKNDEKQRDFGQLNWYNQHRFNGMFMFKSAPLKEEDVVYTSGQRQAVELEQEPEYTLELKPIPAFKHNVLRTDILMADNKLITDYNFSNFENYYKKKVIVKSGYDPKFYPKKSKLASVVLTFIQEFNKLKKFRS